MELARCARQVAASVVLVASAALAHAIDDAPGPGARNPVQDERGYVVVGDGIPQPLTGIRGDPARGRAIVATRQIGLCLLCHSGPIPEERFQGTLAPDLSGAGSRWNAGQLRLRLVDSRKLNPATIMPSYFRADGFTRVGATWHGRTILGAQQIEDVVAFLLTLTAQGAILPEPLQVSAHAWAWIGPYEGPSRQNSGFRMNLGFIVGTEAVAVVDTGYTEAMAEEMVAAIRRITPLPVRHAIDTNSQPHRFMGNDVFRRQGARVWSSREAASRMVRESGDFVQAISTALELVDKPALPAPPDRLIEEQGTERIDLGGGVTLEIQNLGRAHTGGSLIVRVSPDRTVFAGDVLYAGRLPAVLPDSSITGWIAAFERLGTLEAATFVPGHGQPGPLTAFELPTLAYLKALKSHMDAAFKAGLDPSTAARAFDGARWRHLVNFSELADRNASLAYLESEREGF